MGQYEKAWEAYNKAAAIAKTGNGQAKEEKAKIMNEIRQIERAAARDGKILNARPGTDGTVTVEVKEIDSKRSLQEEYVRKFDDEKVVKLGGKETTLRKYHAKRLLNRA
jgi:hypothetical protein